MPRFEVIVGFGFIPLKKPVAISIVLKTTAESDKCVS
jgi:hypothetical protein